MNEILVFAIDKALAKGRSIEVWENGGTTNVEIKACPIPIVIGKLDNVDLEEEIKKMASRIQAEKEE